MKLHLPTLAAMVLAAAASTQAQAPAASPATAPAAPAAGAPAGAPAGQPIVINPGAMAPRATPTTGPTDYTDVPAVDLSKLSEAQKKTALKIMNEERCNCGCGFTVAACRHKDQKCPVSPGLGNGIVADLLAGKPEADIRKGLAVKAAPPPPPPLDDKAHTLDNAKAPFKGPKDAKVSITEFTDFQCPYCSMTQPWLKEILAAYPKDVKVVFRNYPLPMHQHANFAHQAAMAADAQGKFWELHDKMFDNFRQITPDQVRTWAKEIGLDMAKFNKALEDGTYKAVIEKDMKEGNTVGVQGTPTFFINGKRYNGGRDLASVKKVIDAELTGKPAADTKPAAGATGGGPEGGKPAAPAAKPAASPAADKPAAPAARPAVPPAKPAASPAADKPAVPKTGD